MDYPDEPNVITKVLRDGSGGRVRKRFKDATLLALKTEGTPGAKEWE